MYCVLSYKIYCAYTPSNGAMALLNKIFVYSLVLGTNSDPMSKNIFGVHHLEHPKSEKKTKKRPQCVALVMFGFYLGIS